MRNGIIGGLGTTDTVDAIEVITASIVKLIMRASGVTMS